MKKKSTKNALNFLSHGSIIHFKARGVNRLFAGLNISRSGIALIIEGLTFVATVDKNKVRLIPFGQFNKSFIYISSRPQWIKDPIFDVLSRLEMNYKSDAVFVAEMLGAKDFEKFKGDDVFKYCIAKEWLSE